MARPVIALLTDFGTRDHYAGTMKGVALGICPDATLVDISHDLPAHDVLAGALELAAAYKYFPVGTIFLVVVDPGVGSGRRGIAAESGDYRFVAPDNGVLTAVLDEHAPKKVVELSERRYARPTVSRTFEGRDRFAPAAAWLAKGIELTALGRPAGSIQRLDIPQPTVDGDHGTFIRGQILRVDRFGNLITNIDRKTFERLSDAAPGSLDVRVGPHAVSKVVSTYSDVAAGEVCALFGSTDHLEIAANGANASETLALGRGALVQISRRA
ncbi:MAG TPA: SAM-dependent chlorinase/fluorinase [Vicinamibacterales bacterium]|nr:SAM-dependent chlorinase/fluorinase [Vicinamibacterales bacterium]